MIVWPVTSLGETVELKSWRLYSFHVNCIVFQTSHSWCQSTLMSFENKFWLAFWKIRKIYLLKAAFSNNMVDIMTRWLGRELNEEKHVSGDCVASFRIFLILLYFTEPAGNRGRMIFWRESRRYMCALNRIFILSTHPKEQWHNVLEKTLYLINQAFIHHWAELFYWD